MHKLDEAIYRRQRIYRCLLRSTLPRINAFVHAFEATTKKNVAMKNGCHSWCESSVRELL